MATLAPINTPMRQPFGILNDSKIRNLQSVKNRQNAITPNSAPSLKRRAVSPEISDSENVDPNLVDSIHKRKRSTFDDDVSLSKPRYTSTTISSAPKRRYDASMVSTPRLDTMIKPTTPMTAPAAAGRSPTRKRSNGLLNNKKRFAQPSFNTTSSSLSISAALNGTLANRKPKKSKSVQTIQDSKPKSWFFDIFEETEEVQDYRMNEWTMTQSAYGLDISDDESKTKERLDKGKENVDPNEMTSPVTRSMTAAASNTKTKITRKGQEDMTDDRVPLGDLNPSEFYAEGLDATSVVLVHDEVNDLDAVVQEESTEQVLETKVTEQFTFASTSTLSLTAKTIEALNTPSINQILSSIIPTNIGVTATPSIDSQPLQTQNDDMSQQLCESEIQDIEIWESQSAKDELEAGMDMEHET